MITTTNADARTAMRPGAEAADQHVLNAVPLESPQDAFEVE